jgi:hypothetical protein
LGKDLVVPVTGDAGSAGQLDVLLRQEPLGLCRASEV